MDSDRELLELAAKAAGIVVRRSRLEDPACVDMLVEDSARNPHEFLGPWNPLTDDGDALRLAVKLEIDLSFYTEVEAAVYAQTKHLLGFGTDGSPGYQTHAFQKESYAADACAATRRAIVRAAADLGATNRA